MVTVFGLGFVGLTTALGFAQYGLTVYGIDADRERAASIAAGRTPFVEPGLDEALADNLGRTFFVTDDVESAVTRSEYVFYCVGTPCGADGQADLTHIYAALDSTLPCAGRGPFKALVIKSTVPPSTTREKILPYVEARGFRDGVDLCIANNPEFLREGRCWDDFIHADRIVLGVSDDRAGAMLGKLYERFNIPICVVSLNTGEFVKYLSNTMLSTLISYANEMSIAADMIGDIDVPEAFRILHRDKRWNGCAMTTYVYPGCGYGGYCLPKDTGAFHSLMQRRGLDMGILSNVISVNDGMADFMADRIVRNAAPDSPIGVLGLSFKPGSDDVRDTPAARILESLIKRGYGNIRAYDPVAIDGFRKRYDFPIEYKNSQEEVLEESGTVAILTAWDEFKGLDSRFGGRIIDCRYVL